VKIQEMVGFLTWDQLAIQLDSRKWWFQGLIPGTLSFFEPEIRNKNKKKNSILVESKFFFAHQSK
jgi:hypothetical protein